MIEIIEQVPPYITLTLGVSILLMIYNLIRNGLNITTEKFSIRSLDDAIIIEKIIEIAYEISYIQSTKKMKRQMKFFEEKIDNIFNDAAKRFRKILLKNLNMEEEKIFNLEEEDDMITFKNSIDVVKSNWKDYVREFYRNELTLNIKEDDIIELKKGYIEKLEQIRINSFNLYYRDKSSNYNRKVSRNEIYEIFKSNEHIINLELANTFNNALFTIKFIETEKDNKLKELEGFFKGKKI